jgi:signal peptidase I
MLAVTVLAVVTASVAWAAIIVPWRRRLVVVIVDGDSMAPTYRRGDHVLVRRVTSERVLAGDVVVIEKPSPDSRWRTPALPGSTGGRRWMIKRAVAGDPVPGGVLPTPLADGGLVAPGMLVLLGDNRDDSYDSRIVGFFPADRVLGIVVRNLTPSARQARCRSCSPSIAMGTSQARPDRTAPERSAPRLKAW